MVGKLPAWAGALILMLSLQAVAGPLVVQTLFPVRGEMVPGSAMIVQADGGYRIRGRAPQGEDYDAALTLDEAQTRSLDRLTRFKGQTRWSALESGIEYNGEIARIVAVFTRDTAPTVARIDVNFHATVLAVHKKRAGENGPEERLVKRTRPLWVPLASVAPPFAIEVPEAWDAQGYSINIEGVGEIPVTVLARDDTNAIVTIDLHDLPRTRVRLYRLPLHYIQRAHTAEDYRDVVDATPTRNIGKASQLLLSRLVNAVEPEQYLLRGSVDETATGRGEARYRPIEIDQLRWRARLELLSAADVAAVALPGDRPTGGELATLVLVPAGGEYVTAVGRLELLDDARVRLTYPGGPEAGVLLDAEDAAQLKPMIVEPTMLDWAVEFYPAGSLNSRLRRLACALGRDGKVMNVLAEFGYKIYDPEISRLIPLTRWVPLLTIAGRGSSHALPEDWRHQRYAFEVSDDAVVAIVILAHDGKDAIFALRSDMETVSPTAVTWSLPLYRAPLRSIRTVQGVGDFRAVLPRVAGDKARKALKDSLVETLGRRSVPLDARGTPAQLEDWLRSRARQYLLDKCMHRIARGAK